MKILKSATAAAKFACFGLLALADLSSSSAEDFSHSPISSNTAEVAGYTGLGGFVQVPTYLGGLTVVGVGANAMRGQTSVTAVDLPDAVSAIGEGAFKNCTGLRSAPLEAGLVSIGSDAFQNCVGITHVTVPSTVTFIGGGAFRGCSNLVSVIVGQAVREIGEDAFTDAPKLTSVLFMGDPPLGGNFLPQDGVEVFRLPESVNWPVTFAGHTPAVLSPKATALGLSTNQSEFSFVWDEAGDLPMDVEFRTSLTEGDWVRVARGVRGRSFTAATETRQASFYRASTHSPLNSIPENITRLVAKFTGGWGKGAGSGLPLASREFGFTPAIAQHSATDWGVACSP